MTDSLKSDCPCCSQKAYKDCCERFHLGLKPETAQELMRSRYAAFALNLPDYIMDTTHPDNAQFSLDRKTWGQGITEFSVTTTFQKLRILKSEQKANWAVVTFVAFIEQGGQDRTFTEKSTFERIDGQWLYKSGQLAEGVSLKLAK